jgi:YfiH family protein
MIQSPALDKARIAHGFFTREGGASQGLYASLNCGFGSGDDKAVVMRNRDMVAAELGVPPARLLTAYQVHSPDVLIVDAPWQGDDRPRVDALVTVTPEIAIGVLTADCGPILFADAEAGVVGAAHAGWKGALTGVSTRTVEVMETLGARRSRMVAVLGPMISAAAYEVGPEFVDRFIDEDRGNVRHFASAARPGHKMFDLAGYILARLRADGIGLVERLDLCTFTDERRFFSYRRTTHRRETDYGRQISAIALR